MKKSNIYSSGDQRKINSEWFTEKVHMKVLSDHWFASANMTGFAQKQRKVLRKIVTRTTPLFIETQIQKSRFSCHSERNDKQFRFYGLFLLPPRAG